MSTIGSAVARIARFRHLTPTDLRPPQRPNVFFDPIDTEIGIWATTDLLEPDVTVLDLGSGSGAAAAAVARAGARHVHGVDISADSVTWANEHYARHDGGARVGFSRADYSVATTPELLAGCPFGSAPAIVTSNPPYVPLAAPSDSTSKVSIDGGPDGLRLVRHVVRHAAALNAALAITVGSYTSPRSMVTLLRDSGYQITGMTIGALPLGDHTLANQQRVLELAACGEGPLIEVAGTTYYLVLGMSCRRIADPSDSGLTPDDVLAHLHRACSSATTRLECLDGIATGISTTIPLRVVVIGDDTVRLHH